MPPQVGETRGRGSGISPTVSTSLAGPCFSYHARSSSTGASLTNLASGSVVSYADSIDASSDLIAGRFIPSGPGQSIASPKHIFTYASALTDLGAPTNTSYGGWRQPAVLSGTVLAASDGHEVFFFNGTTWTAIPFFSGDSTAFVGAINGAVIVGWSEPSFHPWIYNTGTSTLTDLGVSKWGGGSYSTVQPMGINASATVVGLAE